MLKSPSTMRFSEFAIRTALVFVRVVRVGKGKQAIQKLYIPKEFGKPNRLRDMLERSFDEVKPKGRHSRENWADMIEAEMLENPLVDDAVLKALPNGQLVVLADPTGRMPDQVLRKLHRDLVKAAIDKGDPVPMDVRVEYEILNPPQLKAA